MKKNRMTVLQIRRELEEQIETDKKMLEQNAAAAPTFKVLQENEQSKTRIKYCRKLLRDISIHRPSAKQQ